MFLTSLFQECTKCHTTTTELHQSSFFGQKKTYLPPDLIVVKWVTVQHIRRTFKYKDLPKEQNPHKILVQQVLDL